MGQRLRDRDGAQLLQRGATERATGSGDEQTAYFLSTLTVQALPDGAVLAVDRPDFHASPPRLLHDEVPRHDQRLFVGKSDHFASPDRLQRGAEADKAGGSGHDDISSGMRYNLEQGLFAGNNAGQSLSCRLHDLWTLGSTRHQRGPEFARLLRQQRDIAACRQCDYMKMLREAPHHVQRLPTSGASASEQGNTFRKSVHIRVSMQS